MNLTRIACYFYYLYAGTLICFGQNPPVKYGKVEKKEAALTYYEGADAVILCDYGQYNFNGKTGMLYFDFTRHLRIKILTEAGLRYAMQQIKYYDLFSASYYPYNPSYSLRAHTLNVNGKGRIVESKVKFKTRVVTEPDENFNASLTIHFPDVKPGSIIEYLITIPTMETVNPAPWMVQYDLPCLWNELRIISLQDFNFAVQSYNIDYSDVSEIKSIVTGIQDARRSVTYYANQFQFVRKNVPSLPYSGNDIDYNKRRMYLKFMLDYATKGPQIPGMSEIIKATDPVYKYMNKSEKKMVFVNSGYKLYKRPDLKEIAKDLNKSDRFGIPLILNMGLNDTLKKLTAGYNTDEEKVMAIYNYVRVRMEWNNKYRLFMDPGIPLFLVKLSDKFAREPVTMNTSLQKVIHNQEGSNSEINGLLINMLRAAGFKTNPVIVSTLNTCILDTTFFNLHQFNHLIAEVIVDGREILLDAVKKGDGSIMSSELINQFGLRIELRSAQWIQVADPYPVPEIQRSPVLNAPAKNK